MSEGDKAGPPQIVGVGGPNRLPKHIAVQIDDELTSEENEEIRKVKFKKEQEAIAVLSLIFAGMISQNVFYARILCNFYRVVMWDMNVPGIGHRLQDGRLEIFYHPDYILSAGHIELMDRLEHECIHILNNHIKRSLGMLGVSSLDKARKKLAKDQKARWALNTSLDMAANYELYGQKNNNKPKDGEWVMASDEDFKFELNQPAEVYYDKLREEIGDKIAQQQGPEGQGNSSLQDSMDQIDSQHQWFGDGGNDEDQTNAALDRMGHQLVSSIQKAMQDQKRSRGTVPAGYQAMIDELFKVKKIPWEKRLRQKVHATFLQEKRPDYAKPLKQRLYLEAEGEDICLFPSKKKLPGYTVIFSVDTSGSMSDADLMLAASELFSLVSQFPGSRFIIIQCDAAIEKEFEIDSLEGVNLRQPDCEATTFYGRGGTDFNPPFARFKEARRPQKKWYASQEVFENRIEDFPDKVDAIIYATDGYAPAPELSLKPDCQVFWLLTEGATSEPASSFGSVIWMDSGDESNGYMSDDDD